MRRSRSGERIRRQWGRLLSVSEEEVSRRVLVAQAAGENTLTVDNGYIFGDNGWVQVGDQVTQHTGWDEDTQTLTLVDDLTAAVEEGDRVGLWSHSRTALVVELTAQVDRDGVRGVPLECGVDESLLDSLPVGPRDVGEGEDVLVEYDPEQDSWTVIRTSGQARIRGLKHEPHDPHVLTSDEVADGSFTHTLVHSLIVEDRALLCLVNGVAYSPAALDIDAENGTVTVALGGWETADNAEIWFDYWYRKGALVTPADPDPPPPVTPTWRLACKIADYEDTSGTYHYPSGPLTGNTSMPFDGFNGDYQLTVDYSELGGATFADLGIVGWKVLARCTGDPGSSGHVGFVINLDNPHYPGAPQWPDGGASGGGITIDSYWGDGVQGSIPVTAGVTEVFEHELAVNSTASDPYYEGFNYNDMLGKLEVSLKSTYGGFPHLVVEVEGNGLVGACTVEQFDIVLIGTP